MKQSEILKTIREVGENQFDFDVWYAQCWSMTRGGQALNLANGLISLLKKERRIIGSCLDICSGSGEFISILRNVCTDCVGIDTANGYLEYAKSKCSDVEFKKVDNFHSFKLKRKFDLISCNGDVINMFTLREDWLKFFETVNKHLEKGGLFLFDFYTKDTLNSMSGTIYEEGENLDYVSKRTQNNGLCVMSDIYYIKESSVYYRKTSNISVETSFETDAILSDLEKSGFSNVRVVDSNLMEIKKTERKDFSRLHILCEKK